MTNDVVQTVKHAGCTIRIIRDEHANSPDSWGNDDVFLVASHRQFAVRRTDWPVDAETFERYQAPSGARPKRWDNAYKGHFTVARRWFLAFGDAIRDTDGWLASEQEAWDARLAKSKRYYVTVLGAHIHGGVVLYAGGVSRDWDSGNIGYIVVDREAFKANDTLPDDKRCEEIAECLVSEWNTYLEGRVFGYVVEHDISGEEESCWGYYCEDWDGTECLEEARHVAESLERSYQDDLAKERAAGNDPCVPGDSADTASL